MKSKPRLLRQDMWPASPRVVNYNVTNTNIKRTGKAGSKSAPLGGPSDAQSMHGKQANRGLFAAEHHEGLQTCLSLAGAGRHAGGLDTGRLGAAAGLDCSGNDVRVGKRSLRHLAEGLARTGGLLVLLVGGEVEGDEEDQV